MIDSATTLRTLVRTTAPVVWRSDRKRAEKLLDFAATEAGSALDMWRAAELCQEPKLRRLFLRHAADEARHARMFRDHAHRLLRAHQLTQKSSTQEPYREARARRQDLYAELGEVAFVAFVHFAERRGQAHFASLARHFRKHPQLGPLFDEIEKDERFHVSYSGKALQSWREQGRGAEVRRAIWKLRFGGFWRGWRRVGRQTGDHIARLGLTFLYVTVVPLFALASRFFDSDQPGWHAREHVDPKTLWRQW